MRASRYVGTNLTGPLLIDNVPFTPPSDVIYAADYGLRADGETDDLVAISEAWDAVVALPTGGTLEIPRGTIYLSETWYPPAPGLDENGQPKVIQIRGAGYYATVFKVDTTNPENAFIINFGGEPGAYSASSRYPGIVIVSDLSTDTTAWGFDGVNRTNSGTVAAVTSNSLTLAATASPDNSNSYYNNMTLFITSDPGNSLSIGQAITITTATYNGATKVISGITWASGGQPSTSATYGILMDGVGTNDQKTRGCGRIGFFFTDGSLCTNVAARGGHGWLDWRGSNDVMVTNFRAEDITENVLNFYAGADEVTDPNCEHVVISNGIMRRVGEGIDCVFRYGTVSNLVIELIGQADEGLDTNSCHYSTFDSITILGGDHAINCHGQTMAADPIMESSFDLRFTNITAREFVSAGFSILFGSDGLGYTVTLGPAAYVTGGTFTLTYSGQTTSAIAYDADAATIQTALEALSNLVPGDVTVTGSVGGPFTVSFIAGKGAALTGSGTSLTTAGVYFRVDDLSSDLTRNISIVNCSLVSSIAGAKGIEASWTSTSVAARIKDVVIAECFVDVDGVALACPYSKNLTVVNSVLRSANAAAILGNNASWFSEDVTIDNCRVSGKAGASTSGVIEFGNCRRPTVRNSVVEAVTVGYAIVFKNCFAPVAERNVIIDAASHGIQFEWTGTGMIHPDLNLRTRIHGNDVRQFGSVTTGRFGISGNVGVAGSYTGISIRDNFVTYAIANSQSRAYNFTATSPAVITFAGNECTDIFAAGNKWTLSGAHANSAIYDNKFGTTFGAGIQCDLDGWYQENVPQNQAATEAGYYHIPAATTTFAAARWIAPRAGSIIRVWVKSNAVTTNGTLTATVYVNGSTTGFSCSLNTTDTTYAHTLQAPGADIFAAGDEISIYITTNASFAPNGSADIRAGCIVEV